jgi:large subunit ribosomal protein L21
VLRVSAKLVDSASCRTPYWRVFILTAVLITLLGLSDPSTRDDVLPHRAAPADPLAVVIDQPPRHISPGRPHLELEVATMYAVIETGGKQYRVAEGDKVRVEKLEAEAGSTIALDRVLMLADGGNVQVGKPFIEGSMVSAEVAGHGRHDKVKIIKFRRRKHHLKRQGHRQWYTELRITGIGAAGAAADDHTGAE